MASNSVGHLTIEVGHQQQAGGRNIDKRERQLVGKIGERDTAGFDLTQFVDCDTDGRGELFDVSSGVSASGQRNGRGYGMCGTR